LTLGYKNEDNGIAKLLRDTDKNGIDLVITDGNYLHPIEIKTTSGPTKSMINAFYQLENIPITFK